MKDQRSSWAPVIAGMLAFVVPAVLYLTWPSFAYSGDDLQYALVTHEQVDGYLYYHPAGGHLFEAGLSERAISRPLPVNPRYLLEQPTSILVARVARATGWGGPVTVPLAAFRALVGSFGVLLLFCALRLLGVGTGVALLSSVGLSVSATYWTYSTHLDQSINMVACVVLAFYLLVRMEIVGWSARRAAGLALALVLASFYNFTAALTAVAFGLALLCLEPGQPLARRAGRVVGFLACYGTTVLVLTLVAVALMASPSHVVRADFWREALFVGRPEYGVDLARDAARAGLGLARSQVAFPGVGDSLQAYWDGAGAGRRLLVLGFYGVVLAALAVPLRHVLRSRAHPLWLRVFVPACLLLHGLFNWLWDPGFIKYWLVPLVAIWIAWGALLGAARRGAGPRQSLVLASGLVAATFVMNLVLHALPDNRRSANDWIAIAERLGRDTGTSDFFVSVGAHPLDFHITYFAHRNLVSTNLVAYAGGQPETVIGEQVQRHRAAGGAVYVFSNVPDADAMAAAVGVTAGQLEPAWAFPEATFYRVRF